MCIMRETLWVYEVRYEGYWRGDGKIFSSLAEAKKYAKKQELPQKLYVSHYRTYEAIKPPLDWRIYRYDKVSCCARMTETRRIANKKLRGT